MKRLLVGITFLILSLAAHGQDSVVVERDTLIVESKDTTLIKSYATRYNPTEVAPRAHSKITMSIWKKMVASR